MVVWWYHPSLMTCPSSINEKGRSRTASDKIRVQVDRERPKRFVVWSDCGEKNLDGAIANNFLYCVHVKEL